MGSTDFAGLLQGFFLNWLTEGRNLSPNTVSAYRDTFALFLRWAAANLSISAEKISMNDFTSDNVNQFLEHLAHERGNTASTINARLAAIHAFCRYAIYKDPARIDTLRRVIDIPKRKTHVNEVDYLTRQQIDELLAACDQTSQQGRATHLMIVLLFNTGARISELINLTTSDIESNGKHAQVLLTGKGRKQRCLPLWQTTADEVAAFINTQHLTRQDYLFPGRNVNHLTRSGARSRLDTIIAKAALTDPALGRKRIGPHTFRHSTAMAMLQAGVELSTIAIWLGHENIQTTHKYMVADMTLKQAAIAKVHPANNASPHWSPPTPSIIEFLESL